MHSTELISWEGMICIMKTRRNIPQKTFSWSAKVWMKESNYLGVIVPRESISVAYSPVG
tara:strand:+ start:476 stop:652 length:177 start_codon:yes stop_codon:yes gene_type:complete